MGRLALTMDTLPLRRDLTVAYWASLVIVALVAVMSAAGLAWGPTRLYGIDPNEALGVSASTAGVLVPGFLAQDIFNLVLLLPILLGSMWLARRGSLIGLLLWPGALFYVLYTYVHYLIGAPLSVLFLGYAAAVASSACTTIGLVVTIDGDEVRQRLAAGVPARIVGGILVGLALLTIGQDGGGLVTTAFATGARIDPPARGVWTADLTLAVPAMLVVGGLLWRRAALGYVAGAGLLLSFGMTSAVIAAMLGLQPLLTGAPIDGGTVIGLLIFGAVSLMPLLLYARGMASRRREIEPTQRAGSAAARTEP
jgi:hypothetical protein